MSYGKFINSVTLCVIVLLNGIIANEYGNSLRSHEICSGIHAKRMYLEYGDSGFLGGGSDNVRNVINSNKIASIRSTSDNSIQYQCYLEIVSCPSCIINVTISFMNLTTDCDSSHSSIFSAVSSNNKTVCQCDYIHLSEPPYDAQLYGKRLCGLINNQTNSMTFVSKTRALLIKYIYRTTHSTNAFSLHYFAKKNSIVISGEPSPDNLTNVRQWKHHRLLTSPFFPSLYPRDIATEYVLKCNESSSCRIRVLFTDFQISVLSTMEFYDSNGERIEVFSGTIFRPPLIISTGPTLKVKFYANGATGLGFRAELLFLTEHQINATHNKVRPITDCGGHVETLGGAITMMHMVSNETESKMYDCYWLIRPPSSYFRMKTHMSLRVAIFENMAPRSELIIRKGMTSDRSMLDVVKSSVTDPMKFYVASLADGFYVSFRGVFNANSKLALVYTAFSLMECYIGSEFLCENRKCIPVQLQCDGFDHCGDKSDEPDSCVSEWAHQAVDRRWYSHTPNYYFPKNDRYPDLRSSTMVFIGGSLGFIFLITSLIVLLYKLSNRARQQRELQDQLQTISELLDNNARIDASPPVEEPPAYEAPPDYDEVIKVGMDETINRKEQLLNERRQSRVYQNAVLEVILPPETGGSNETAGATSSQAIHVPTTTSLILIDCSPSESAPVWSSNAMDNRNHKYCQTNMIPDSPPPLYKEYSEQSIIKNGGEGTSSSSAMAAHQRDLIDMRSASVENTFVEPCLSAVTLRPEQCISVSEAIVQTSWLNFPTDSLAPASDMTNDRFMIVPGADSPLHTGNIRMPSLTAHYQQSDELAPLCATPTNGGIECEHCGGAIVRRCSIDDSQITCFGQIRLFDSIRAIQSSLSPEKSLICHCDQIAVPLSKFRPPENCLPTILQRYRSPTPLQRSSSVELFTLLPRRQSIYRSIGSELERKLN